MRNGALHSPIRNLRKDLRNVARDAEELLRAATADALGSSQRGTPEERGPFSAEGALLSDPSAETKDYGFDLNFFPDAGGSPRLTIRAPAPPCGRRRAARSAT